MENEINEFIKTNKADFFSLIEEARNLIHSNKIVQERVLYFLNILYYILKGEKSDTLLSELKESLNEEASNCLKDFVSDEKENILNFFSNKDKLDDLALLDFDWKFVCLSDLDSFAKGEINPKILLKLNFNNQTDKIIESDFSNLKKLQEEIEYSLSSFNSTYAKRIQNFSK